MFSSLPLIFVTGTWWEMLDQLPLVWTVLVKLTTVVLASSALVLLLHVLTSQLLFPLSHGQWSVLVALLLSTCDGQCL